MDIYNNAQKASLLLEDGTLVQGYHVGAQGTAYGEMVFNTVIPRNIRLSEAPSHGLPVILYDAESRGATSHMQLAKEIIIKNRRKQ